MPVTSSFMGIRCPDDWRTNERGKVALHDQDPLREWSEESAECEPVDVAFHEPSVVSLDALVSGDLKHYLRV